MEKNKKGRILITIALTSLLIAGAFAATTVFWQRSFTHTVSVYGIIGDLLVPSYDGYNQKIVATDLDANNMIGLTIYFENFYNEWLNVTQTNNAVGLTVTVTGQYYTPYIEDQINPHGSDFMFYHFEPNGTSFDIPMDTLAPVDKTQMIYTPCGEAPQGGVGSPGHLLVLTFNFDTEFVQIPANYDIALSIALGHT